MIIFLSADLSASI